MGWSTTRCHLSAPPPPPPPIGAISRCDGNISIYTSVCVFFRFGSTKNIASLQNLFDEIVRKHPLQRKMTTTKITQRNQRRRIACKTCLGRMVLAPGRSCRMAASAHERAQQTIPNSANEFYIPTKNESEAEGGENENESERICLSSPASRERLVGGFSASNFLAEQVVHRLGRRRHIALRLVAIENDPDKRTSR